VPGPDRARRAWERHEKIGPPAAAKVVANFLPSSPAHSPAHSPALRSPGGRPYERCDVHPSTRELRGCPASSAGAHQASSSARGGVARVVRLALSISATPRWRAHYLRVCPVFWAAPPIRQQSPERFFCLSACTEPSSPSSSFLPTHRSLAYEWSARACDRSMTE